MKKKWKAVFIIIGCFGILVMGIFIGRYTIENKSNSDYISQSSSKSLKNADVLIQIPNLRQYSTYTCGTTCVQMIMNWAYPGQKDINLADLEKELGSTDADGTTPQNILHYFKAHDVNASMHKGMHTKELVKKLDQGNPVILAIQAWSTAKDGSYNTTNPENKDTYLMEGHYVICTGYRKKEKGYDFYFNDPATVGLCYMSSDELNTRWIDMDGAGNVYDHTGIEINMNSHYSPDTVYHLD